MSDTGKRQRKFYEYKKHAELARDADLERHRLYGVEGHSLPASKMGDAAKALDILEPLDITLTEAARHYEAWHNQRNNSRTLAEAWQVRLGDSIGMSDVHQRTMRQVGNKILPQLGDRVLSEIGHEDIRNALSDSYPTPHGYNLALRTLRPVFRMALTEGWVAEDTCKRLKPKNTGRHEIKILTLNQCRKLITSAKDYTGNEFLEMPEFMRVDATGAIPALALMLFAGVRPGGEIGRLEWNDIDMNARTVFVSNRKAKTDRSRYIAMPDTLHTWLELTPMAERVGSITPPNWKKCWQAIRHNAGIADLRDACRKTFATAHLQAFEDIKKTRAIMGHETDDMIFTNYRGLMTPTDAKAFWQILPSDSQAKSISA